MKENKSDDAESGFVSKTLLGERETNKTENEASAKSAEIVFWLLMLFVASVTMTVGNKFVMKQFPYANFLTLMQNGTAVGMLGFGHLAGMIKFKKFALQQWKIFAFSAFFLAMQIVTSLQALPLVAIATVVAFRNMCTVVIACIDYFVFKNRFSRNQVWSLVLTTIGMLIYAGQDVNFNFWGYIWLVGNSVATISNTFWNKFYITKFTRELKIQTSFGVSFIQQTETLPLVLFMALSKNEFAGNEGSISALPPFTQFILLITCFGGFLIGITYPKCFALVSGTSVVVASTANKAMSILIGMYVFGTELLGIQIFGLLICIGGSLWYAIEGKRKK